MGQADASPSIAAGELEQELEKRIEFFEAFEGDDANTPIPRMTLRQFMPALVYTIFLVVLWVITAIVIIPSY